MGTPASAPSVGIVILNWNRPGYTVACLASLKKSDYPSFETVVVDNGSSDGSAALIRDQFPGVTIIENGRNLGFAAGNNVGIAFLMDRGVEYLLLLNDDTEVAPDLLRALVEEGEGDPTIGILGPTVYYHTPANVIWSAGGMVDKYGETRHRRLGQEDTGVFEEVREVDYVTGCALLVKRSVVERVGLLDRRFFAYFEETEWCARARKAGFRTVYVPRGRVWHKIQSSERASSPYYIYLMARNRLLYLQCSGAGPVATLLVSLDLLRTAASWSLNSEHKDKRAMVPALLRGVGHYAIGRFGLPPTCLLSVG